VAIYLKLKEFFKYAGGKAGFEKARASALQALAKFFGFAKKISFRRHLKSRQINS